MNRTGRILALTLAAAAGAAAYAVYVEPRWLQLTRTRLHYAALPRPLEGLRIALLSDMHARPETPQRLLDRMVELTLAEAPDIIAVTGDLAEDEASLERVLDALARLRAQHGVYVVPGNHDYRDVGIERWHDAVSRRRTLIDLTNRTRYVDVSTAAAAGEPARLCVAGVDDLAEGSPRLDVLYEETPRDFTILLAHNPDQAERSRRVADRVDLVLSGHTHGGQVRMPGIGAIVNSAEHADLYEAGVRRRPWTQVYTSRGIGTAHLPIRFLARPEIAVLTLTRARRPDRWR